MEHAGDPLRSRIVAWTAHEPPFAQLLAINATGDTRPAMLPAKFHYNPLGTVHGGVIATVLDVAMTEAVQSALPPGRSAMRLEIQVTYLRGLTQAAGEVHGEGTLVQAGRRIATATSRLVDATGRLYATASSTFLLSDTQPPASPQHPGDVATQWSDPHALAEAGPATAGLDFLRAIAAGRLPLPPVLTLLGITMDHLEPGATRMSLPSGTPLLDASGHVHGGMIATLVDTAMGCAVHSTLPQGRRYTTVEIKVNFLHAIPAGTGRYTAAGSLLHTGHQVAVAEARVTNSAGALCATASTTCLVFDA